MVAQILVPVAALLDPIIAATSTTAWQGSRGLSEGGVVAALLDPITSHY